MGSEKKNDSKFEYASLKGAIPLLVASNPHGAQLIAFYSTAISYEKECTVSVAYTICAGDGNISKVTFSTHLSSP